MRRRWLRAPTTSALALTLALFLTTAAALLVSPGCRQFQRESVDWGEAGHRFLDTTDGRVHYRVEGSGPPVLLVHGFASSMVVWSGLLPSLCEDHTCVMVDLPGFGLSDKRDRDYTPGALADTLVQLLDEVDVRAPADVVAHSWGCSIALEMALRHPQRVNRLVLASAWAYSQQLPTFFEWARVPGIGAFLWDWFYTEQAAYKFSNAFHDPDKHVDPAVIDLVDHAFERPGAVRAARAAAAAQRYEQVEERYPDVAHRTLLVWGADDEVAELHFGERLKSELAHARLETLHECGHMPMLERPQRFNTLVRGFLTNGAELTGGAR